MKTYVTISLLAISVLQACQEIGSDTPQQAQQSEAEIADCVRNIMELDEGRWAYMGTIARRNGKFRTYETTSEHERVGPDTWSTRSFGGDVEVEEADAEASLSRLVGTALIPLEDDALNEEDAVNYTYCQGPDAEGRYEAKQEYRVPYSEDTWLTAKSVVWYSEHGSYYAEDIFDETGRIIARRSGVNTPAG